MKKILALAAVILLSRLVVGQDSSSYSLQQCIKYGIDNHNSIKNAQLDADGADSRIKETIGTGLPQVNGKLDFVDNLAIQSQFLPANIFNPSAPADEIVPLAFGLQYSGNANVTVNQLIFDGTFFVGLEAARAYKELSKRSITQSKIEVAKNVTSAYYMVLVGQEQLEFLQTNKGTLDSLLRDTRIMYENGFVEKLDVDRIEVNLNNTNIEIDKVKRLNETSMQLLKFQMGMPLDMEVTLTDDLEGLKSSLSSPGDVSPNFESRIEYRLLESQKLLHELDRKRYKVMAYPSAGAFLSAGYNTGQNELGEWFQTSNWREYAMFGVSIQVPIFSGFTRKHRMAQAQTSVDKTENDLKMLELSISFEVAQYKNQLENALSTMKSYERNVELAESVYNTTKIKYKAGVGSNLEVVEAEGSLKQAKSNYNSAIYDALMAKMNLDKALGKLYTE